MKNLAVSFKSTTGACGMVKEFKSLAALREWLNKYYWHVTDCYALDLNRGVLYRVYHKSHKIIKIGENFEMYEFLFKLN